MKDKLRLQAEALAESRDCVDKQSLSTEEMKHALHELCVHQIELELQNEELRRAQVELEAVRARYFDLYDMAPVGYCTVSEKGLTLEANLTAATMLGMHREEMVGQPWTRCVHKEDQDIYYRHRRELFNSTSPAAKAECELRLVNKTGSHFWALLTGAIALDDDGNRVCRIVIHDIAARKEEEQFREDVQRIIHHDIKGPLISLHSLAQLFQDEDNASSLRDLFPQVVLGVRQVIHLIDAVEPLREMERGEYTPTETQVEVHQLLDSIESSSSILSTKSNVSIIFQPSAECVAGEARVCGEAFLFEDMFLNLVKNAIEASPGGGSVTIACRVDSEMVHVTIHNVGAVPESIRDRFFEKYATKGKRFGTGLGTYSAQLIAKAHGGHIGLTTSEADGTTVSVSLPRCDVR